ncbi:MAG: DNA-3-methyladenine glycosylase I [Clostridium sp.]|nr:DNA-3-methyladenine glycosylase I [Lachnoclostridium sp.]MCM1252186.1 DNA-3-methyladenine glycosylase I [Clostridium sp.]
MDKIRCKWCNLKNERYVQYHDEEWGVPTYDDETLFEFLLLEPFQAGLSWETILNKRENFRKAFSDYDIDKICHYGEKEISEMLQNASIIRNHKKIEAAINNTKVFRDIQKEWGSFSEYIWHFTNRKIIYEAGKAYSALSDEIANDMKKRGMKFIGTTTVYAYLQSIGIINSHDADCFMYKSKED